MADTDTRIKIAADVHIDRDASIVTFTLLTEAAWAWVDENVEVEDWQWLGATTFACDLRYAGDLAVGMFKAGLVVA